MINLFEHNQIAYCSAEKMLCEKEKAAVISPTGTGKSFVGFKLCDEHPESNMCWLSPSSYIFDTQVENLKKATGGYVPGNIHFFTYSKLMVMSEAEIDEITPDFIILDEFHRCGAEHWGDGVKKLISKYPKAKLLGLSATNIRYLDNQRDMALELFSGNVASEMTLGEAIVRGILTPPKYVTTVYSYQDDFLRLKRRVENHKSKATKDRGQKYLESLRRALEKSEGLQAIFQKHITDTSGKYLVFCSSVEHMNQMISHVPEWFYEIDSNLHLYKAYSSDPATSKAFNDFKHDTSDHLKLLFCIDMLNEGIHVDDVAGVILFRPTVSPIVFKQQIGRALASGTNKEAVIIDVVDNISNLYSIDSVQDEMNEAIQFYRYLGQEQYIVNEKFVVTDETKDCKILFEELERVLSTSWDNMYAVAKKYYSEHGNLLPNMEYHTEEGYALGHWVVTQRTNYSKGLLSRDKIDRLSAIGMNWLTLKERIWQEGFELAKEFYLRNSHLHVQKADNSKLSDWVYAQRVKYKKGTITQNQYLLLSEIGMEWEPDSSWNLMFQKAKEFFETNGNLDIPANYITTDGYNLGNWYRTVLRNYRSGKIDQERKKRLEEIGIQSESVLDRKWRRAYEEASAYFTEHGDLNVKSSFVSPTGFNLGGWISSQRYSYKLQRLTSEQIELLEQICMSWHRDVSRWENGYLHLSVYSLENGDANPISTYVSSDGFALGTWANTQRLKYKAGKLKPAQIHKLESMGFVWNPQDTFWSRGFEAAQQYKLQHGNLMIPGDYIDNNGFRLGNWLENLRSRYKNNKLEEKKIEMLEQLGVDWHPKETAWNSGFYHAQDYVDEGKNINHITEKYKAPDGFALGSWIRTQRRMWSASKLSEERQNKLESIGMVFARQTENHFTGEPLLV